MGEGVSEYDGAVGDTDGEPVGDVEGTLVDLNTVAANTGRRVGDSVGVSVGIVSVGWRVGYPVGEKVPPGELVGDSVGNPVGDLGGASVENSVGDSVGDAVGEPVGESDGDPEGTNMYGGGSGREGIQKLCGECYAARDVRCIDGMWMGGGYAELGRTDG